MTDQGITGAFNNKKFVQFDTNTRDIFMITNVWATNGVITMVKIKLIQGVDHCSTVNYGEAIEYELNTRAQFDSLKLYEQPVIKSSVYCLCTNPDKQHNIGAGTLDFYICRICKKEIK